ncbi:MAG TPA: hypothetical protein DEP35_05325 [Deltaproteobacteria bacterium]|nr:hypothetical protein [Deltaproteobacteria bacterium]
MTGSGSISPRLGLRFLERSWVLERVALGPPPRGGQTRGKTGVNPPAGRYPGRALAIEAATREILEKKAKGEPLVP